MRSKNSAPLTAAEKKHLGRIKELPCVVCGSPPISEAHHIEQGNHYLCIPVCADCHRGGFNGIHGQARIWKAQKLTELDALNKTIARIVR